MCSPPPVKPSKTELDQLSLVMIIGVSASGKSTIGQKVAEETDGAFVDSDVICPQEYVEKMRKGRPLTDADRKHWYHLIVEEIAEQAHENPLIVVACSAQKEAYRRIFKDRFPKIIWFHLTGEYELVSRRLKNRKGHFFPLALLQHQFDIFEPEYSAIMLDISIPPEQLVDRVLLELRNRKIIACQ